MGLRGQGALEPRARGGGRRPNLDLAVRDVLAVYSFPGMWDWQRSVVLPLVGDRGPERVEPGRLGSATWGPGRGAARPRFGPG